MFVSLNAKSIVDNEPTGEFVAVFFNISNIGGVVERWNDLYARIIPMHGAAFLVTIEDWKLLKKQIETEQRKR